MEAGPSEPMGHCLTNLSLPSASPRLPAFLPTAWGVWVAMYASFPLLSAKAALAELRWVEGEDWDKTRTESVGSDCHELWLHPLLGSHFTSHHCPYCEPPSLLLDLLNPGPLNPNPACAVPRTGSSCPHRVIGPFLPQIADGLIHFVAGSAC